MNDNQLIANLLKFKNVISDNVYKSALAKLDYGSNKKIDRLLIEDYKVPKDEIYREIAKYYAIPQMTIDVKTLQESDIEEIKRLISLLPKELKKEVYGKRIIPYKLDKTKNQTLLILSSIPTDSISKLIASSLKYKRYEVIYCPFESIDGIIRVLASTEQDEYLRKILSESESEIDISSKGADEEQEDLIQQEINKGALAYLFEAAIIEGVKSKVSDIHIIPYDNQSVDIRFRIDGKLLLWKRKENIMPQAFLSVVKDRTANVDRFKIDEAQDGYIQRDIDGTTIRFRVSIMPIVAKQQNRNYESIVIRILDDRNVIENIDELGFQSQARKDFEEAVTRPQGLIVVTGPTGSGKSTTLLASLYHVITPEKNILTVEDPVEYVIKGARQIKIGLRLDFNQAIRSILRHDPDIVMVGEMRDKETAETAIKLANTGHLTFSTLHTNDAPSAISRLYKMEIETFLIAYAINIIVAQRLVRRLCDKCKKSINIKKNSAAEISYLLDNGITEEDIADGKIFTTVGCDNCRGTGYKGRLAIHEALFFNKDIRHAIVESKSDIDEEMIRTIARKNGMLSLRESGIELIRKGMTTMEEVVYTTTIA